MKTTKLLPSRQEGFTLVEIMIVVAIIGLLAAVAIPNFVRARVTAQTDACINNLRQIDAAKQQWALEQKKADTATPDATDVTPFIKGDKMPVCPGGGTYSPQACNANPLCSVSYHTAW